MFIRSDIAHFSGYCRAPSFRFEVPTAPERTTKPTWLRQKKTGTAPCRRESKLHPGGATNRSFSTEQARSRVRRESPAKRQMWAGLRQHNWHQQRRRTSDCANMWQPASERLQVGGQSRFTSAGQPRASAETRAPQSRQCAWLTALCGLFGAAQTCHFLK